MGDRVQQLLKSLRKRIEDSFLEYHPYDIEYYFKHLDEVLQSSEYSDLEKAFFLILNQFGNYPNDYHVHMREKVLVDNVYDFSQPCFEYELDFAIYSGSRQKPIKIAIECDGLRSHRERYSDRDRRKDVNLQAAGWIVLRLSSRELHDELEAFDKNENHISEIAQNVENIVQRTMDLLTRQNYVIPEIRSLLTGYLWGWVTCPHCDNSQQDRLNHTRITCRHCGAEFQNDNHGELPSHMIF